MNFGQKSHDPVTKPVEKSHDPVVKLTGKSHDPSWSRAKKVINLCAISRTRIPVNIGHSLMFSDKNSISVSSQKWDKSSDVSWRILYHDVFRLFLHKFFVCSYLVSQGNNIFKLSVSAARRAKFFYCASTAQKRYMNNEKRGKKCGKLPTTLFPCQGREPFLYHASAGRAQR